MIYLHDIKYEGEFIDGKKNGKGKEYYNNYFYDLLFELNYKEKNIIKMVN